MEQAADSGWGEKKNRVDVGKFEGAVVAGNATGSQRRASWSVGRSAVEVAEEGGACMEKQRRETGGCCLEADREMERAWEILGELFGK